MCLQFVIVLNTLLSYNGTNYTLFISKMKLKFLKHGEWVTCEEDFPIIVS